MTAKRIKIIIALVLLSLFIGYTVKRLLFNPMNLLAAHQPPPVMVQTITVTKQNTPIYFEAVGSLQAKLQVILAPEVPGRVSKLPFTSGQSVQKNDVVMALDDSVEQAGLKKAKAERNLAKVSLERTQNLVSRNVKSKELLDQKESDYAQAEAAMALAEAHKNQKEVKAPFEGDLGIFEEPINLGGYVQAGQTLVSLTNRHQMLINFSLDEKVRSRVKVGQPVSISVDAYPHTTYEGTITSIDPQIKEQTRGIMLQATINNKDLSLFPGMYAHVKVIETVKEALVIPEVAINHTLYGSTVYLVKDEGGKKIANLHAVKIEQHLRNAVEVTGLKEGDTIVSIGHAKLENGAPIQIDTEHPLPVLKDLKE